MSIPPDDFFNFTLHVRDNCLCLHVQRAARALARRFDEVFRPLGITHGQFSLMMSLNRPQPASMTSVSTLLAMDRTTLTANLKVLERKGLVNIMVNEDDKRSRLLSLTAAGKALLAQAAPIWKKEHAAIERLLEKPNPDQLRSGLVALS
jgi:DNA-binding MarR family transcriptional regulator